MSVHRPSKCKQCGRGDDVAGRMSRTGLCNDCGELNKMRNTQALRDKSGPEYEAWLCRYIPAYQAYVKRLDAIVDERYAHRELHQARPTD